MSKIRNYVNIVLDLIVCFMSPKNQRSQEMFVPNSSYIIPIGELDKLMVDNTNSGGKLNRLVLE